MNILSHFDIKTFLETNLEWPIIIIKAFFGCEPQMGYYFYIIFLVNSVMNLQLMAFNY